MIQWYFIDKMEIDLTQPDNWSEKNASEIAIQLGYVLNGQFIEAVVEFRNSLQRGGQVKINDFILPLAINYLRNFQLPLERVPTHSTLTMPSSSEQKNTPPKAKDSSVVSSIKTIFLRRQ